MKALAAAATIAAALLAAASPAAAQAQAQAQAPGLSVADFLGKAQAVMMAGAQVSPDDANLAALREEITGAGKALRAQQTADAAAGRPATYCVPTSAQADASEIIQHLMKIPAAQRSGPFRQAFFDYARAKYPCPAR